MDLINLIQFVVAREQRKERQDFEEHASNSPNIHLVSIMPVSHQTLGSTVPTGRNILREGRVVVKASATSEICEFNDITRDKDVLSIQVVWLKNSCYLRLNITMEDGILMHMLYSFKQLVDVPLHSGLAQVVHAAFNSLIHVHFHDFKHKGQTACRLIAITRRFTKLITNRNPFIQTSNKVLAR